MTAHDILDALENEVPGIRPHQILDALQDGELLFSLGIRDKDQIEVETAYYMCFDKLQ